MVSKEDFQSCTLLRLGDWLLYDLYRVFWVVLVELLDDNSFLLASCHVF